MAKFGVPGAARHPQVQIQTQLLGATRLVRNVTQVEPGAEAAATQAGAFPLADDGGDVATVVSLEPGAYTATATSDDNGIALLELYDLTD